LHEFYTTHGASRIGDFEVKRWCWWRPRLKSQKNGLPFDWWAAKQRVPPSRGRAGGIEDESGHLPLLAWGALEAKAEKEKKKTERGERVDLFSQFVCWTLVGYTTTTKPCQPSWFLSAYQLKNTSLYVVCAHIVFSSNSLVLYVNVFFYKRGKKLLKISRVCSAILNRKQCSEFEFRS
jgi:hypothetical protein